MKKLLASVLVSVAATLAVVHVVPESVPNYQEMRAATWRLDVSFKDGEDFLTLGFCSGVAIAPDVLLTAAHCDLAADEQFMFFGPPDARFSVNGRPYTIIKKDVEKDLMLIKVDGLGSSAVSFLNYTPEQESRVYAVGYPAGLAKYVTEGRMQDLTSLPAVAEKQFGHKFPKFLAISAPVVGGNSGGGVFIKAHGHYYLVGIVSMAAGTATLAVSPEAIEAFLESSAQRQ